MKSVFLANPVINWSLRRMNRCELCVRCKKVAPENNQYMCRDCKKERNNERYKPKKKTLRQAVEELKLECKCGSKAMFLIDKPLYEYSLKELAAIPLVCLNCLLTFNGEICQKKK